MRRSDECENQETFSADLRGSGYFFCNIFGEKPLFSIFLHTACVVYTVYRHFAQSSKRYILSQYLTF